MMFGEQEKCREEKIVPRSSRTRRSADTRLTSERSQLQEDRGGGTTTTNEKKVRDEEECL